MKHNYTDTELQAAIDTAFPDVRREDRFPLDMSPSGYHWKEEAPNRLTLIKSALASLPEPEPPKVDGKTPGEFYSNLLSDSAPDVYYTWSEMSSERRAEMQSRLAAVLNAFGNQSQPQLSQLRILAEAGEVPEGCVRVTGYKSQHSKAGWVVNDLTYYGVTHFADIRLPAPDPLVTKPISLTSWTPEVGDVVTLKSGGAKMTVVKLADTEGSLLAFLCEWFSDSGEYDSGVIYLTSLQPA